jgi:hypothetical protein
MSPPCTPYRWYPSRRISSAQARAVRPIVQPAALNGVENAYPGKDGTTRWKAWPVAGLTSGSIR